MELKIERVWSLGRAEHSSDSKVGLLGGAEKGTVKASQSGTDARKKRTDTHTRKAHSNHTHTHAHARNADLRVQAENNSAKLALHQTVTAIGSPRAIHSTFKVCHFSSSHHHHLYSLLAWWSLLHLLPHLRFSSLSLSHSAFAPFDAPTSTLLPKKANQARHLLV